MQLPDPVKATIRAFFLRFGFAQGEDAARELTHKLCEQVAWSHPGQGYGHKFAGPGRPHSADALAQLRDSGQLWAWDLIGDAGGANTLNLDVDGEDITGQVFEHVTPTNHLGIVPPVDVPPTTPAWVAQILLRLDRCDQVLEDLREEVRRAIAVFDERLMQLQRDQHVFQERNQAMLSADRQVSISARFLSGGSGVVHGVPVPQDD